MNLKNPVICRSVCFFSACYLLWHLASCTTQWAVTSAEEYFTIGMAYFEIGKYAEAEKWLNRAKAVDKTKTASEYNLGRIAFENKRYNEAFQYFNRILAKDPDNVMVLKAAAYTQIKLGDLSAAEALYDRVLGLAPESADDGYNYALILYSMERYDESEAVLAKYPFALLENSEVILLSARIQKVQQKPEALDSYAQWLETNSDNLVRYEYASMLESQGFYARALEECRTILKELPANSNKPKKSEIQFAVARLLLTADPESEEGITELQTAVAEGFDDPDALEALLNQEGIGTAHKDEIQRILDKTAAAKKTQEAKNDQEAKQSDQGAEK